MERFQQQQLEGTIMKPSLSHPDDASCGAASDVAISGEQFIDEKPTFVIQSQSDNSSVSVYLLSNNPKEAVTSETVTSSCCSTTSAEKTHTAPKISKSSSSSTTAAKPSGAGSRYYKTLDKRWYENLERIKPCIVDGKIDYSCIDEAKDRKKLGDFIYIQRKHFRLRNNNEDTPLTDERLKALMDINFPFDVLKKTKGAESGKSSSKKDAIILSLTDEKYRQLMEEHFKKLGAKLIGDRIGEKQVNEEKATAQQVFNELKGKGGRFVRLANPRNLDGGHEEMDDDEALKKIRQDINRRMGTAKRWLDPKHPSSAKDKASMKKRSQSNNHVQPSKRPCINTFGKEKRSDNPSKPKCSVKGDKLEYIGNYIANHLKEWEPQQRTNRLGLDYYVIYRVGVDKKTAVEGKDKFTGYDNLAIWAFKTHYYTQHVVETVPGKEILERLGIVNDPYSIFVERDKELNTGERAGVSRDNRCDSSSQQLQQQTNANSEREKEIDPQVRAGVGKDNRPPSDSAPQQLPQHTSASSARLPAAGSGNSQNVEGSFNGFKRFRQTVSDLKSMLSSAEEKRDEDGVKFFGHLCRWVEMKSRDAAFVMSFRRDDIDAAVQEFKSLLSDSERTNDTDTTFKNLVEILIDQTTKIFPVADN